MGNFSQDSTGHFHEVPRGKIAATTAALLIAVPAAAITISLRQSSTAQADSVSVHSTVSSSQADPVSTTVTTEAPAPSSSSVKGSRTTMTVNGQSITVPDNGTTTQTIETDGGSVNVQATGSGQATNNNGVTTNINVQSSSTGSSNSWSSTNVWVTH